MKEQKCYCGRILEIYPLGVAICPQCEKVSADCDCEVIKGYISDSND